MERRRAWQSYYRGYGRLLSLASIPVLSHALCCKIWRLWSKREILQHNACDSTGIDRSEEHTSELQSLRHLVCRLLLEKNKTTNCCRYTDAGRSLFITRTATTQMQCDL